MTTLSKREREAAEAREAEADAEEIEAEEIEEAAEDDGSEDDAQDAPKAATREKMPRPRLRTPAILGGLPGLMVVLVLVNAVLVAAAISLWFKRDGMDATETGSQQAVHAASQAARDLSSYDYRTLESDFKTATGETTGKLRTEYAALAQQIRATAIQQQAISQTTVIKAGAESASADQVTVIVFANRSATTTASQNRLPEPLRIRMTMVKVKDRWLASDLQVL
jgi:Mce-associated membrane protein